MAIHERTGRQSWRTVGWWLERIVFVGWLALFFLCCAMGTFLLVALLKLIADDNLGPLQRFDGYRLIPLGLIAGLCYFLIRYFWSLLDSLLQQCLLHSVLFTSAALLQTIVANFASYLHTPGPVLYDVGFAVTPEFGIESVWRVISEILTVGSVVIFAITCLLLDSRKRTRAWIDWCRLMSIMYLFRACCLWLTSLPGPAPHCNESNFRPPSRWVDIVTWLGPLFGEFKNCGDLLFSGHTGFVTTNVLLARKQICRYWGRGQVQLYILSWIYLILVGFFIIASRKHYTVDVVLGLMISHLSFARFEYGWFPVTPELQKEKEKEKEKEKDADEMV